MALNRSLAESRGKVTQSLTHCEMRCLPAFRSQLLAPFPWFTREHRRNPEAWGFLRGIEMERAAKDKTPTGVCMGPFGDSVRARSIICTLSRATGSLWSIQENVPENLAAVKNRSGFDQSKLG